MKFIWMLFLCCISASSFAANPTQAKVLSVDVLQLLEKTKLTLTLSNKPTYKIFRLSNPDRLVIDLPNTSLATNFISPENLHNTPISALRSGFWPAGTKKHLRLVFEVKNVARFVKQEMRHQLIITLFSGAIPSQTAITSVPPPQEKESFVQRDVIVAIDPGHGGKDPGAIGFSRTAEKDVVLAISKKLQVLLERQPGMRAVLTRRGDYFVGLRQRLLLARKDRADMFIAIHADAFRNIYSSGASVYALSASGASSEAARWLAEKENYSELGNVSLEDKNDILRSVLLDLSQTATISLSLQLGSSLLRELAQISRLHHVNVEQARFVVLKSPDIPSVLVETGFISNTKEERRLRDPIYQQQIAQALMQGIRRYFISSPPPGTIYAVRREKNKHVVRQGETIGMIAKRFSLSVNAIREANQLTGAQVKPGQVLLIPG